jgi:hypothetical protein
VVRHRSRPGPASAAPGLLLLGLAALAKENFLLPFVIALVVLVLVAGPRRLGRRDWVVVGSLGAFALADLVAIALRLSAHGSQYAQVRSVASARQWAGYALRALVEYQGLYFALFFLVVLVALDPGRRSRILWSAALALVFFGSQVAFYAGSEQAGRYLYPAVLVGPLLWVLVADRRHRAAGGRSRSVVVTGVLQRWSIVALVPALALGVTGSHRVSERTALTTQSFQRNLHDIEREVREAGVRVVVLEPDDPLTDQEPVLSLARYLSADLGVTVMTLPAPHDAPGLSRELGRQITDWSRHGGSALSPYRTPARCLAIVFGTQRSECALAVPPPY